jgi:hypothetical protein
MYISQEEHCFIVSGSTEVHHGIFGDQVLGFDHLKYNSVHSGTWVPILRKDRPHIHPDRRLGDVAT